MHRLTAVLFAVLAVTALPATAQERNQVFKNDSCQCCLKWMAYMMQNGFALEGKDISNSERTRLRAYFGIKTEQAACHTALIGGYVIEGHVPAEDVKRLLAEKPDGVLGLSVPGMPAGSPGMEMPDGTTEPYDVLLMKKDGTTGVFARH